MRRPLENPRAGIGRTERGLSPIRSASPGRQTSKLSQPSSLLHPLRVGTTRAPLKKVSRPPISRLSKAPEGWRSPRRFARFGGHRSTRQRLGLRWPSTAFSWRTQIFKRRSSNPNRFWQRYWPRSWRTVTVCAGPLVARLTWRLTGQEIGLNCIHNVEKRHTSCHSGSRRSWRCRWRLLNVTI